MAQRKRDACDEGPQPEQDSCLEQTTRVQRSFEDLAAISSRTGSDQSFGTTLHTELESLKATCPIQRRVRLNVDLPLSPPLGSLQGEPAEPTGMRQIRSFNRLRLECRDSVSPISRRTHIESKQQYMHSSLAAVQFPLSNTRKFLASWRGDLALLYRL